MGIPNSLVYVINRDGETVKYDISKIANGIKRAIIDVENATEWIAENRAKKYAEKIHKEIFDRFYNFDFIMGEFVKLYCGFNAEERETRLENALLTERLSIILLESFAEFKKTNPKEINKFIEELNVFIKENIERSIKTLSRDAGFCLENLSGKDTITIGDIIHKVAKKLIMEGLKEEHYFPKTSFVLDVVEDILKKIGEIELAEGFMIFREGINKLRSGDISKYQFTNNGIHREICLKTIEWNIENECENIFSLNDWIYGKSGKKIEDLINLSEERYKTDVRKTAKKIIDRIDDVKIVIIAGPSSSNKTTTTLIIKNELGKSGLKLKQLNVDDYYKNIDAQPKDEFGDFDFEMPESIDIELLNNHFTELLNGMVIKKPNFNFKIERRDSYSDFYLEKDEILLIDCLHGLYKNMTASVPRNKKFSVYIESMNIIRNTDGAYTRWTDARMLKRMIRDVQFRGYDTKETLAHWPYVRKGELKHIIPYIFSTDAVINSGLPYELPALKTALTNIFPDKKFIEQLRIEGRLDPYIRGIRIRNLLETIAPLENLDLVPKTSPLREFIGGSVYSLAHN
ncbi:MAG TPA: hypothetical protein PKY81_04085 [bacterium]|nr:hypothetical protein [bacterium]HPN30117.1 hypothetical protein [bacterium]